MGSTSAANAPFKVSSAGVLTTTGASITGGSITITDGSNNTLFSASSSGVSVTGAIHASSGSIDGRLSIGSTGDIYSVTSYTYEGLTFQG